MVHPLTGFAPLAERAYRKKSLLIHPDKLKHPRGIEAFDLLKKVTLVNKLRRRVEPLRIRN